jgi:hypothetical protein
MSDAERTPTALEKAPNWTMCRRPPVTAIRARRSSTIVAATTRRREKAASIFATY